MEVINIFIVFLQRENYYIYKNMKKLFHAPTPGSLSISGHLSILGRLSTPGRLSMPGRLLIIGICVLCLASCGKSYEVAQVSAVRHRIDASLDSSPNMVAADLLSAYQERVREIQAPVLGVSLQHMEADRPESLLSNLAADILREASSRYGGQSADVGVMNMGGLRSSLPEGDITVGDVYKVFPFENKLFTLSLTGDQLLDLFRRFAAVGGQGVSGAQLTISKDGKLLKAAVAGRPIDKNKEYRIATIDYLAEGNDGMSVLREGTDRRLFDTLTLRQVVTDYIVAQTKAGKKIESTLDGRIRRLPLASSEGVGAPDTPKRLAEKKEQSQPATVGADGTDRQLSEVQPEVPVAPLSQEERSGDAPVLTLFHSSDTHSCIDPDGKSGLGGYVRRATFMEQVRKENPHALMVDCGDFSQGSLYYNLFKGEAEIALMNAVGYDVVTVGNHEFDFGLDNMARIFAMAEFPVISSNYDFGGTVVEDFVSPYHVVEQEGVRIGFVGVGPQLKGLVAEAGCKGVGYSDPIMAADSVAMYLKEHEACDVVVCLSHLGWDGDKLLIAGTRHLNLVLGGHSHSYFDKPLYYKNLDGRDIMLMHVGKNGQYVSETTIRLKTRE